MPDICVWNKCNNKCLMCTNPADFDRGSDYLAKDVIKTLQGLKTYKPKDNNRNYFLLTGGEPTLNPELFLILAFLVRKFPESRLGILSNGRMFAYRDFSRKIFKYANFDLAIPVHGFDAKSHDAVTRAPGSFNDMISGLENIKTLRNGQGMEIRIILTRQTIKNLEKITKFVIDNIPWASRVVFIFMEIEGQAEDNVDLVGIRYSDVKNIDKVVRLAKNKFDDVRIYHFPLCVSPRSIWGDTWRTLRGEEVTFAEKCGNCNYKDLCLGIHVNYLRIFGDKEFKPIRKKYKLKVNKDDYHHPIV